MKVTLPKENVHNANTAGGEQSGGLAVVAMYKGEFAKPVMVRLYWSRSGMTAYASIWVRTKDRTFFNGSGKASGYGYHKASSALQAAIDSAGIELSESISGRGESAMRDALEAIARAAGYRKTALVDLT